ncbi:MAG: hypothetical protein QOE96_2843 [Blastocatellia bacterium]|nr:hypothetical protein [Blastocatellia bacterium]
MSDAAEIRLTKSDREIFQDIFLSLESHRPAKSENDILDEVARHFGLPAERKVWPDTLVSKGEPVDAVLEVVFEQLGPFMNMVLELYHFLSKMVSTAGGRTTHFEISGDGKNYRLDFPDVGFPKKVKWIQEWGLIQTRIVTVDWNHISQLLIIDNGIFYGHVQNLRFFQSLIIARREGALHPETEAAANRLYETLLYAVRAWWGGYRANNVLENDDPGGRWIASAFVPALSSQMEREGRIKPTGDSKYSVGIDLEIVLGVGASPYSEQEAFTDASTANVDASGRDENRADFISPALFFVALWGLDDTSFRKVASLLTAHEARSDTLRGFELESRAKELSDELLADMQTAIVPTGDVEESDGAILKKVEILLLPYWKDRWFLYEVWSLSVPLVEGMLVGAKVELLGIEKIANQDVEGTTWNLPTQKARNPVAKLSGPLEGREMLVWFQRETRSRSAERNIEPDIRITTPAPDYEDLLILECKDRVKFGKARSEEVAQTYLDGSLAKTVWIVNYEDVASAKQKRSELSEINGRFRGIAYNFKPGSSDTLVRSSIRELFNSELCPPPSLPSLLYLVIDISGSMRGKRLPPLAAFDQAGDRRAAAVYLWQSDVRQIDFGQLARAVSVSDLDADGAESAEALKTFAASLPPTATLTIVTDSSGKATLEMYLPQIAGHAVDFIIL